MGPLEGRFLPRLAATALFAAALSFGASAQVQYPVENPTSSPGVNAPGEVALCRGPDNKVGPCDLRPPNVNVLNPVFPPYPLGAIPVLAVATGSTAAVTATIPALAGKTFYLCGFDVSALGGTATVAPITITNMQGNVTLTYQLASTASGNTLGRTYTPCVPAKAMNTSVAIATTADGTATAVDVNIFGFYL